MIKIRELALNKECNIPLVVIAATPRVTKAQKPYLALDLFDGVDKISGNYWDWTGKAIPEKNAILNVQAQVTEWQGAKQLNIKGLTTNTELHLNEFMPAASMDVGEVYKDIYQLASDIDDDFYRDVCLGVFEDLMGQWLVTPAAVAVHHAYSGGTLVHTYSVAKLAKVMAEAIPEANVDLVVAGALLHDIGKLFGYKLNGLVCEMTDEGMMLDHLFIGAEFIGGYASAFNQPEKLELLRHIILSHHGKQEHGAVVFPVMLEAHIVHHADAMDASAEMIRDACRKYNNVKWTDRIWTLNNRQHLTFQHVQAVMSK